MLVVSIGSGQIISKTGRYRIFPIVGTFGITIGLFLLSRRGLDGHGCRRLLHARVGLDWAR